MEILPCWANQKPSLKPPIFIWSSKSENKIPNPKDTKNQITKSTDTIFKLEGKQIEIDNGDESDEVNYKGLFFDVLNFDISEKDTVRLSASTLDQLFKDENYNLDDIRKNKLVKPINIDLLPSEIKSIENANVWNRNDTVLFICIRKYVI